MAVRGESFEENVLSDWGIRSRRSAGGALADFTVQGEDGGRDMAGVAGDFTEIRAESAGLVAVDGCEIGDGSLFSIENFEKPPALTGLVKTGVRALRKSVYASGGVIGVALPSSRLMSSSVRVLQSLCISEGKMKVFGVFRGCKSGFWAGILLDKIFQVGREKRKKVAVGCFNWEGCTCDARTGQERVAHALIKVRRQDV